MRFVKISAALFLSVTACATSTAPAPKLRLRTIDAAVAKPSNVALYFFAENETPDQFEVFEDGQLVSQVEAKQLITSPLPIVHYSLVLVDLSSSVAPEYAAKVQAHVDAILAHADATHKVAVFAFDGGKPIMRVRGFDVASASSEPVLAGVTAKDPSTNLNGAILTGLQVLSDAVRKADQTLKFGTLIVLTDGTDRAKWVAKEDMLAFIERSDVGLFLVGLGKELDRAQLDRIARGGPVIIEPDTSALETAIVAHFKQVDDFARRYFLLSYCSPARAGVHELKVVAKAQSGLQGHVEKSFSAEGFGPTCDPMQRVPLGAPLLRAQRLR